MPRKTEQTTPKKKMPMAPTIVVLFGITGDLAKRKVLPALFDLFIHNQLPDKFALIGYSHRILAKDGQDDDDGIRSYVRDVLLEKDKTYKKKDIDSFVEMVHYQAGDFTTASDYGKLAHHLVRIEDRFGMCSNKLFHLAVPPKYYSELFKNLAQTGLTLPCTDATGWSLKDWQRGPSLWGTLSTRSMY